MSRYVPDTSSRRWVIIAPGRTKRPEESEEKKPDVCIFCEGNEQLTPEEVFRIGEGSPNTPGWKVRVISNRYPITDFHEVIIHSPDDTKDIENLPTQDIELIFKAYRERYNVYREKGQVLIFCNHGEHAGTSIKHPHSQLVVIPNQIAIDELTREPINNKVEEDSLFTVYCPEFSQWPYEVWITPKKESTVFGDITDEEITALAPIMQRLMGKLENIYNTSGKWLNVPFGYNYYIYPKENWYLRIIPRFIHRAGFELGTGLSVNVIDPSDAARELSGETVHVK